MKPFRILCIDDDKLNGVVMEKMLSAYELDYVLSGSEGVVKALANAYDLIIMDINLGILQSDGASVMHLMRENGYSEKPIIAVTGYDSENSKEKFIAAGFDAYFTKPVQKTDIVAFITGLDQD